MAAMPNIILFGETGSGKSSIINMVAGCDCAGISSGAAGCTFESTPYEVDIMGATFRIFDTAGLDEGETGTVPKVEAVVQLYKLINSLSTGVSLLVFCMRGPRIKDAVHKNWKLFYEIICKKQVPIVMAITGLENEEVMDDWWMRNMAHFANYQMHPFGVACITATRGRRLSSGVYRLDNEYEESKRKMCRVINSAHLQAPWNPERVQWFVEIVETTYTYEWCGMVEREHRNVFKRDGAVIKELKEQCNMSTEDAKALAERLDRE